MADIFNYPSPEPDVDNITCRCCLFFGKGCKCIDHRYVHFTRSCFSSDEFTGHHTICKSFSPHPQLVPAIAYEWDILGGFSGWYPLYLKQWRYGKPDRVMGLIKSKTPAGRHATDDVYIVPFEDFLNCSIMREDGIHYIDYVRFVRGHRTEKHILGFWHEHEGPGILTYKELE